MNSEAIPVSTSVPSSSSSISSKEAHPLSLPLYLTSTSSSLKPLRERNRTNLKRRINLSRSQVLSNDFENEDNLSVTPKPTTTNKTAINIASSQTTLPSTPSLHTYSEPYSKTVSPQTPSPIHTTVTCSQVWERLASNDEQQTTTSPKSTTSIPASTTVSVLPTHISFSYDLSDDEGGDEIVNEDKNDFQYVPVSSQSKLVQFQFLTFARQQNLDVNSDNDGSSVNDSDEDEDEDEDEYGDEHLFMFHSVQTNKEPEQEQENRITKKRKRSVSTTDSLDAISSSLAEGAASGAAASTVTKPPCAKKPKIKDPNANFQRLNMRKKNFSHAKKHQFGKNKRNAFYRRMRHAGGH
ncbi:unnamed protein product [Adineta ricciae]|uniref:Uncharacterized protein n=1 Tax=Adineta ricciae TaxID=249248 RepID=A0A813PRU6_ADIRI|nr:unnamed protein product [Adineta ricciae]CAF1078074.1 unnamed protein product [Adineta ricciae]